MISAKSRLSRFRTARVLSATISSSLLASCSWPDQRIAHLAATPEFSGSHACAAPTVWRRAGVRHAYHIAVSAILRGDSTTKLG